MTHAYTEDQLVEQPAIGLFAQIGWRDGVRKGGSVWSQRYVRSETSGEVVFVGRLRKALTRLNPSIPEEAITSAFDQLLRRSIRDDSRGGQSGGLRPT